MQHFSHYLESYRYFSLENPGRKKKRKKFGHLHNKSFRFVCKIYFWWTGKLLLKTQRLDKYTLLQNKYSFVLTQESCKEKITNSRNSSLQLSLKQPCRSQIIQSHIKTYLFIIYILPVYSSKETMTHDFFCIIWASTKSKESGGKKKITY